MNDTDRQQLADEAMDILRYYTNNEPTPSITGNNSLIAEIALDVLGMPIDPSARAWAERIVEDVVHQFNHV